MNPKRRLRLATWLTLLVVGVAVPLLVFAGTTLWWVLARHEDAGTVQLHGRVRAVAAALDTEIRAWKAAVTALAASDALRRERWVDFDAEARRVGAPFGGWVVLAAADGQQVVNTLRPVGAALPRSNPVTLTALHGPGPVVLDPFFGAAAQRHVISVVVPVARDGSRLYVLGMTFGPERLRAMLEEQALPGAWIAGIADRQHRFVARVPDHEQRVGQSVVPALQAAFRASPAGLTQETLRTAPHRVAFQRLSEVPWTFTIALPLAELEATRRTPLLALGFIGLPLVLVAVGVGVVLAHKIARPIQALATCAGSIVRGQTADAPLTTPVAEIQQLGDALAEAGIAARTYEQELEAGVAKRTAEVAEANARLREELAERQHAERGRLESERRYQALMEAAPDPILVHAAGACVFANRQAAMLLGASSADALLGRPILELIHPDDRRAAVERIAQAYAGTQTARRDFRYLRLDGTAVDVEVSGTRVEFGGQPAILIFIRDITERHRAEKALAASQRLLHSILEQAPDGMNVRDRQGCVMFVNRVSRRRALRPPEGTPLDMAPEVWGEFLDADGTPVPAHEWPVAQALRGETATREFLRRTPTGSFYVLNSAAPLRDDRGEIVGAVTMTTDISERKQMEERLREALAQEEQALADNRTLLREVHHRVKNNLQMLCDMLYLQMEGMADAEKAEVLRETYGRIYVIARLHEQLYRAMQSGEVHLGTYLTRLVGGFESLYPAVTVQMEIGNDQVSLDLDRAIHIGLIVNELVTNALKHAFADRVPGEITVRLHRTDETVEIQVRDTGKGLPADLDLAHAKTLGLRIVRILAQRLGATVDIQNHGGTVFTVLFPLHAEAPVEPRPE